MDSIRKDVLNIVNEYSDGIFVTVLDKNSRAETTWDEERIGNFIIGHTLIANVIDMLNYNIPPYVFYDSGGLSVKRTNDFHNYLNFKCNQYSIHEKFRCISNF